MVGMVMGYEDTVDVLGKDIYFGKCETCLLAVLADIDKKVMIPYADKGGIPLTAGK